METPGGTDGELLREAFAQAVVGIALATPDGHYLRANPEFCRIVGYTEQELTDLTLDVTVDAEADEVVFPPVPGTGEPNRTTDERRFLRGDGRVAWTSVTRSWILDPLGDRAYLLVQVQDLEPRRRAKKEAEARAERQALVSSLGRRALRGLEVAALLAEAATAVAETLQVELVEIFEVARGEEALRRSASARPGQEVRSGSPGARPAVVDQGPESAPAPITATSIPISLDDGPFGVLTVHTRRRRSLSLDEVEFLHGVADVVASAVERQRSEERIRHEATHDQLTGLANRALLVDRLQLALARRRRHGSSLAVLFADLDRFKVINDNLGHATGDALLSEVAARLRATLRLEDTVARIGGDEFVMVCEDLSSHQEAEAIAERICAVLAAPFVVDGREIFAPPSIGIALAAGQHATPEELIQDADAAMYQAKARGRARWQLFHPELRTGDATRLDTESGLRHALEREELRVHYQPVIDLGDGGIVGAEALVRWEHPARGLVSPAEFIPLAEETGLIVPLGRWVLSEALGRAVGWSRLSAEAGRPFTMSVNLSARQLAADGLVDSVLGALAEAGLDPSFLSLEITETQLMEDRRAAISVLAELKGHGISIAVDDFGTGYSSLAYLKQLPLDVIKVDRNFVAGLGPDPEDSAIIAAVVSLARTVGLRSIAEGVETADQLARLRELGCHEAQGFLISRPQPADAFEELLLSNPRW